MINKKQHIVLFLLISFLLVLSYAAKSNITDYSPLQISILPNIPNLPNVKNVTGLKLGLPYANSTNNSTSYKVYGMEIGAISESNSIYGFQAAFGIIGSRNINGGQIAWANIAGKNTNALQIAMFNHCDNNFNGCQISPGGNFILENGTAAQLGILNYQGEDSNGSQLGLVNRADSFGGIQIGILNLNYNRDSLVFQVGLLNYVENGFLPIFPFFNFSIREVPITSSDIVKL